ncbi:hypothetical protein SMRU11_34880 [Sinorhizobium meliloti RU11/001]|nr:hypothetical protein SMRU11_34880 [Sinorhizobium meliloti RU11/001]
MDSFGSPTNETLIPPTTSASRSSKNRPTIGPPPTKGERDFENGPARCRRSARVYEVGDRDLTQQHAADSVEIRHTRRGLFDLLIPVLVTGIQPAQVIGLEELFPAPRTRRCSHLWDKHRDEKERLQSSPL